MTSSFIDQRVIENPKNFETKVENPEKLEYHITRDDNSFYLHCEINSSRLNSSEIKALTNYRKLKEIDKYLLNYILNRLGVVQTKYKIMGDLGVIFEYLSKTQFEVFFEEERVSFSKDEFRLNLNFSLDKESNIVMSINDNGEVLNSSNDYFYIKDHIVYKLSEEVSSKFYKEIFNDKRKFSINSFMTFRKTLLETVKDHHKVKIDSEIESLTNSKVERKVAPMVLEVGKTNHFITLSLKYKIGSERFSANDYKYAETANWLDKKDSVKLVKEGDKLIEYTSNMSLSADIYRNLFEGIRIRAQPDPKSPFELRLPISTLEVFTKKVMPKAEEMFEVEYEEGERLELKSGHVRFEVEANLNRKLDLLEFNVKFKIGDEYFPLEFMKELLLKNKKYVQLTDGSTINVENVREISKWIEFLRNYDFRRANGVYKTKSVTSLELEEFMENFEDKNLKSNEEFKCLIQEMKDRKPVENVQIPKNVVKILRDYQKEGVYWLHFLKKYNFGGILADEMGLGKTLQALTILTIHNDKKHIVVCPKTLLYNWESEVKKFFPDMKVVVVDGNSEKRKKTLSSLPRDLDILITSYSMLQKDYEEYVENNLEFEYKILDEAHYVKNMKTLSAKAVRVISAKHSVLLTGTPLENNLDELYGTFDLIMPGYLGSKADFKKDFVSKIERNNAIALELLQAKIRPFILRRTKKDVLKELPDKQEQVVYNEMTNKQIAIYNELLNRVKKESFDLVQKQGFDKSRIQILSALLKLRQICNHPSLLDTSFIGEKNISGKYEQFLELLFEVIETGEKVLVFSQFTSMLDIFEKDLKSEGVEYLRLDGSTKNRQQVVERFNDDDSVKVFLISLKAGGVGLNLTAASAVFMYDPWWNPMAEKQAVDRAHRIGQTKKVNIYKFITRNSIEEKILKLQERKGNLFDNLVVEDEGFIKRLEWEDLMELFED